MSYLGLISSGIPILRRFISDGEMRCLERVLETTKTLSEMFMKVSRVFLAMDGQYVGIIVNLWKYRAELLPRYVMSRGWKCEC